MPVLSSFFGIKIIMYWEDVGQHKSPHFHAQYGEDKAVFALNGENIDGFFPPKQKKYIKKWASLHEDELMANWKQAVQSEEISKIKPLRGGV